MDITKKATLAAAAVIILLALAACASPPMDTPQATLQVWLDTWSKRDLEGLVKLATPAYQAETRTFYKVVFGRYSKCSYTDLESTILESNGDRAKIQGEFLVTLEEPSTVPSLAGLVTRNSVRQIFTMVKSGGQFLVDNIERFPLTN